MSTVDASASPRYPLAVRDSGLFSALGLVFRTLPYALVRFAVLLAFSVACLVWLAVTVAGSLWAGAHVAGAVGLAWFVSCVIVAGWFWRALLRYTLHLIACGHVAVLTELIVHGRVGNDGESMFGYGRRIVTERFGEVNVLFAMNLLVRGVVNAVHSALEGIGRLLPIPGMEAIGGLFTAILRAATRYMDKVIFSYNLASAAPNPWRGAQEGLVYYAQNSAPMLKQAVWIVVLEHLLSAIIWLALLVPAAALTAILPHAVREIGGVMTIGTAVLVTLAARGAFLKPLFLTMIMVRFLALVEHEALNEEWMTKLDRISSRFRDLGGRAQQFTPPAPQPVSDHTI